MVKLGFKNSMVPWLSCRLESILLVLSLVESFKFLEKQRCPNAISHANKQVEKLVPWSLHIWLRRRGVRGLYCQQVNKLINEGRIPNDEGAPIITEISQRQRETISPSFRPAAIIGVVSRTSLDQSIRWRAWPNDLPDLDDTFPHSRRRSPGWPVRRHWHILNANERSKCFFFGVRSLLSGFEDRKWESAWCADKDGSRLRTVGERERETGNEGAPLNRWWFWIFITGCRRWSVKYIELEANQTCILKENNTWEWVPHYCKDGEITLDGSSMYSLMVWQHEIQGTYQLVCWLLDSDQKAVPRGNIR